MTFRSLLFPLLFTTLISNAQPADLLPSRDSMYFPDNGSTHWETIQPRSLGWNTTAINDLTSFLKSTQTRSFMILVNGKIVIEEYFHGHNSTTTWPWNSAGKTLVSATVGIAEHQKLLSLHDPASRHLGNRWTSMPLIKEKNIQVKHLLSMTSGIDESKQLIIRRNLQFKADAGQRWAYGNVFQKLMDIVAHAGNISFEDYFNLHLKDKIGMTGSWKLGPIFKIYHSDTRSVARFGLLAINGGKWKTEQIVPKNYFAQSIQSSQSINPSYGYLWWLNGKSGYILPRSQDLHKGSIIPNAPADLYAAMGANDQRLYIIPSKNMIIVRMGKAANKGDTELSLSAFDQKLWEKINAVIN